MTKLEMQVRELLKENEPHEVLAALQLIEEIRCYRAQGVGDKTAAAMYASCAGAIANAKIVVKERRTGAR